MVEEVTSLKKDFKQKENKYLEEFLDMKALKEKVEDKLYKQDQSLQTVHMLCKPKPYYNEQNKVAIGYKNPLCLTRAKQVQPALYNGYEIIKNNHVPALVHNTEDTLEIAEITRRKMNEKTIVMLITKLTSGCDFRKSSLYDMVLYTAEGMHVVPPPMTGNYMPSGPDIEIDYSQFTYGPKQSQPSESETQTSDFDTCESNCSDETHESLPEPAVNEPKVVSQPKVWSDAPIIEEYESDSKERHVSPKPDKKDCSGLMSKKLGLGFGYTKKACFVCGSFSHLIRDCDFHEKRMAKQAELNNRMSKGSSQREIRPVWNNVQRMNHQNQFVPKAVLTRTGKIPVNTARTSGTNTVNTARASGTNNVSTARHNFNSQAVLTNAARKISTVKPFVNKVRPKTVFHKTHSPFRRPFNNTTALKTTFTKQKVNTAGVNSVSVIGQNRETVVKTSAGAAGYGGAQNRVGNANPGQARQVKCYNYNGIGHIARNCTQPKRPQNSEYFKDKMLLMQAQENGVALDEEQLLFIAGGQDNAIDEDVDEQPVQDLALNVDNVFQADDCDAFDSDVDEAPTAQTMFMANLSSADPVYDEAGPSYDSDILSEVHDHDHYQDAVCEHHEEHEMHDDVQPNYVVDSHANYTSDSNMIPYDQYVKDNAVPVVQSNVSSVPNDVYMMIFNDMHEPHAQSVSDTTQNTVVDNSLTAELATYKEQVELYERRVRFELTKREQKIDEQLRIVITDRNIKEENLKKELHSVIMQLASTINHNKSMVEEVMSLKKDFKQKENKYLEEFFDMKALK
ncbi:retrovirus-related pol polyprotein from transposon TNT 1-94 [Tanacetum coccineum]